MIILLYNLVLPLAFLFFLPGLLVKLIKRGGYKSSYGERFGVYSQEVKDKLQKLQSVIWVHAVSVGETQIALNFIAKWQETDANTNFVLSTTTTTGQALARQKAPDNVNVIFSPIDFSWAVKKLLKLIRPQMLVLFETEIWPNMIYQSYKFGTKVVQVNARISDNSFNGYKRFGFFFRPFLSMLTVSCAQTALDVERLKAICPSMNVVQTGTMKFDQQIPENILKIDLAEYFGDDGGFQIILAASTHPDEEKLIGKIFKKLLTDFPDLRLVIIPRHAERGSEVAGILKDLGISFYQRTSRRALRTKVKCLLADTTGEMLSFIDCADIIIGGKTFAGNDEGQNIIEPALMGKAIVVGPKLKNFRQVLDIMLKSNALLSVKDDELECAVRELLLHPEECKNMGATAKETVTKHIGATQKTIDIAKEYFRFMILDL